MASAAGKKRAKRYLKEVSLLEASLKEHGGDILVEVNKDGAGKAGDFVWRCSLKGPEKYSVGGEERPCPYAKKTYVLELKFPESYPFKAPEPVFTPPLYHPNVQQEGSKDSPAGSLCHDFIKDFWAPTKRAVAFLAHIRGLMSAPDLDTALAEDISKQMRDDIKVFEERASKA